jgi:signal transduction histidine kinase
MQRVVVCLIATAVWTFELWTGRFDPLPYRIGLVLSMSYLVATLAYLRFGNWAQPAEGRFLYFFLFSDPLFFISMLVLDPRTFAFLHPLLLVIVVRSGIRYGLRTMYLSWGSAIGGSLLLLTNDFWRHEASLTSAYVLMLVCVPLFFASLIRRVHNIRAIEHEHAHFAALNESTLARSAFLAKVSHELRSPLQGIVSALDVLSMRRGPTADADDELIGRIRRSSLLLNTHLRDMLTLAKGEAGRLEMRPSRSTRARWSRASPPRRPTWRATRSSS